MANKINVIKRKTLIFGFLLLPLLVSSGCNPQDNTQKGDVNLDAEVIEKVSLALDWYPNSNHSGFYMAKENGHYANEGLEVDIFTPSNPEDVLKTVGAGRDDFGVSYQAEVLLARGQGIPVKSIAAMVQHPLNSIMVLNESGIERPSDLAGKKIGVTGIPFEEALFSAMLEYDGLTSDDVTLINVGFDLGPALIGRKVDAIVGAYWTHESIAMESQGFSIGILRMEEWGIPDFYELVLVTSEDTINTKNDLVRRFLNATRRGFEDAQKSPGKAVDVLVGANPEVDRDLEMKGIALLSPIWTDGSSGFGSQTKEKWDGLAFWMKAKGLLEQDVDQYQAFSSEFIE